MAEYMSDMNPGIFTHQHRPPYTVHSGSHVRPWSRFTETFARYEDAEKKFVALGNVYAAENYSSQDVSLYISDADKMPVISAEFGRKLAQHLEWNKHPSVTVTRWIFAPLKGETPPRKDFDFQTLLQEN